MYLIRDMNPRALDELLGSHVSVRVLRQLCMFPTKEHTGREVARLAEVSPSKGIKALNTLYAHGLVRRWTAGASQLWTFQTEHVLAPPLMELFRAESGLQKAMYDDLRKSLGKLPYVVSSSVFGSTARGDSSVESDVDLLIVVDKATSKELFLQEFSNIRPKIEYKFSTRIRPLVYTKREWSQKRSSPLIKNIRREGTTILEERT